MSGTGRGLSRTARTASAASAVPRERNPAAAALLLSLMSLSCQRAQKDPRVGEHVSPHIVVRVVDRAARNACDSDTFGAALWCRLTPSPRVGCVYAETGDALENPLTRARRDVSDCDTIEASAGRVELTDQPLHQVKFFADERRERVVLQAGDAEWLFLFFDAQLLDARPLREEPSSPTVLGPGGAPDWAKIPSLLDVVPSHVSLFSDDALDALTRATPEGASRLEAAAVAAFIAREFTPDTIGWGRIYARLPEPRREALRAAALKSIAAGEVDALPWAESLALPRAPLIDALVDALTDESDESGAIPESYALLARLAPERLAPLACHRLEAAWFDEAGDLSAETVALAVIAREKLACPWVSPWLLRNTCAWQLRDERDDLSAPVAPLASNTTQRRVIEDELPTGEDSATTEEEENPVETETREYVSEPWGPLLLAAAQAQGPLPREFTRQNDRRFYRRVFATREADDDACRDAADEVSEWACQLPVSLRELHRDGCVVTLDDEHRVMTLRPEAR